MTKMKLTQVKGSVSNEILCEAIGIEYKNIACVAGVDTVISSIGRGSYLCTALAK